MELQMVDGYQHRDAIKELFEEYTQMLIAGDETFRTYLQLQHYQQEIEDLERKYGRPDGRLYLARWDEQVAGCIALRKMNETSCELKRLYVKPEFRGRGIGGALVKKLIAESRASGYSHILLDTLPFLEDAIELYRKYNFYEIPQYNDSPMKKSIYMRLDL